MHNYKDNWELGIRNGEWGIIKDNAELLNIVVGVGFVYRTVITFKDGISKDKLDDLRRIGESYFKNRAGEVLNQSGDPSCF